jgi:hypothetical protein
MLVWYIVQLAVRRLGMVPELSQKGRNGSCLYCTRAAEKTDPNTHVIRIWAFRIQRILYGLSDHRACG